LGVGSEAKEPIDISAKFREDRRSDMTNADRIRNETAA
jgi:hypothetical protein